MFTFLPIFWFIKYSVLGTWIRQKTLILGTRYSVKNSKHASSIRTLTESPDMMTEEHSAHVIGQNGRVFFRAMARLIFLFGFNKWHSKRSWGLCHLSPVFLEFLKISGRLSHVTAENGFTPWGATGCTWTTQLTLVVPRRGHYSTIWQQIECRILQIQWQRDARIIRSARNCHGFDVYVRCNIGRVQSIITFDFTAPAIGGDLVLGWGGNKRSSIFRGQVETMCF